MLVTTLTGGLSVDILTLKTETFDNFVLEAKNLTKEVIQKQLEKRDKEIYIRIDHERFVLIRLDERTILSSYGILKFKRRYYYDSFMKEYCYLLDNMMQIPKSKRMTNELILKMLDLASMMSYKETGEHLSDEFVISKYTVWKTINEVLLETYFDTQIDRKNYKIHVQIDEKFIEMTNSTNKKKYYTMTIFAGKKLIGKSYKLLNKTVISSSVLKDLKLKINDILVSRYKASPDEEIFISGDFATYIKNFEDSIICCKCKYVPDKFHVYKALKDALPNLYVDDYSLNQKGFQNYIVKELETVEDSNAKKLKGLIKSRPDVFKTYLDPTYLGCSQEGQNSHIYAPRFGKYANRFSPSTIEKLSLIREAKAMNAKVILVHKHRKIPDLIDISIPEAYEDPIKYVLDTSEMKYETAKMFNAIKYGEM